MINKLDDRFWSKVDKKEPKECWEFKGSKSPYGTFWYGDKTIKAHRMSWILTNGPIPEGMLVLHKCDNPACCNPDHLYLGTQSDNMCDRAERNPNNLGGGSPKLYKGEIWLIRKLKILKPKPRGSYSKYKLSAAYVAKMFKVSNQTILRIWNSNKVLCREGTYE